MPEGSARTGARGIAETRAHAAFATQTRHLHHSRRSSQILDYVQQKAEQYELERSLNAWRRKVDIAEMEAKRYAAIARKGGILT